MNMCRNLVLITGLLLLAACGSSTPYWEGDGPALDGVSPAFDRNGNLGGSGIENLVVDVLNPTEEEASLLADYIVTISGNFGGCAGENGQFDDLRVQFGARNARILSVRDDAVQVLTPPGPVSANVCQWSGAGCSSNRVLALSPNPRLAELGWAGQG